MSESVTLKSYFYEVLIPSSQKNTSSPIEDILHHVSISFMKKLALYKCFNPRTHTGCDIPFLFTSNWTERFQSTHPHGVRQLSDNIISDLTGFNPRTHTGCDIPRRNRISRARRFQSTHPHGVRRSKGLRSIQRKGFQSTHPHGVRRISPFVAIQ